MGNVGFYLVWRSWEKQPRHVARAHRRWLYLSESLNEYTVFGCIARNYFKLAADVIHPLSVFPVRGLLSCLSTPTDPPSIKWWATGDVMRPTHQWYGRSRPGDWVAGPRYGVLGAEWTLRHRVHD